MNFIYYLLFFIIAISLILIVYAFLYNKFQNNLIKLREVDKEIDESLRKKYDLLYKIIDTIKEEKDKKEFKTIEELQSKNLSSFEFSRELSNYESKIISFKSEHTNNKKEKEKEDYNDNLEEINIRLDAFKKYYNETITAYNKLIVKFPSNIISKISKFKKKNYFDNKNLFDDIEKDFKI